MNCSDFMGLIGRACPTLDEIRNRSTKRIATGSDRTVRNNSEKGEFVEDYRIVLPDGAVRHLHIIGHPILDETGELVEYSRNGDGRDGAETGRGSGPPVARRSFGM